MKKLDVNKTYFFADHEVRVIKQFPCFNLAIVEDVNTLRKMNVDMNFIKETKVNELYIILKKELNE